MDNVNTSKNSLFLITGFMASGKSFCGKETAKFFNCQFIDLDEYIENKENKTINNIFHEKGEEYFRQQENKSLKELIDFNKEMTIISAGGGLPLYLPNQSLMKNITTIFLNTDFETIFSRLTSDEKRKRPLISNLDKKGIMEIYTKRLTIYKNTADYIVTNYKELQNLITYIKTK